MGSIGKMREKETALEEGGAKLPRKQPRMPSKTAVDKYLATAL
jgi:hypothetical protein